jgi:hypothetical protein
MRVPFFKDRPTFRPPRGTPRERVLVILAPMDSDLRPVKALGRRLRARGVEVSAASECQGEAHGEHGEVLFPNLLLIEAAERPWDALVVAGGRGAARVAEDQLVRQLVARAASEHKDVTAIGAGRCVLERAKVDGFSSENWQRIAERLAPPP